jgi:hypothetical protein
MTLTGCKHSSSPPRPDSNDSTLTKRMSAPAKGRQLSCTQTARRPPLCVVALRAQLGNEPLALRALPQLHQRHTFIVSAGRAGRRRRRGRGSPPTPYRARRERRTPAAWAACACPWRCGAGRCCLWGARPARCATAAARRRPGERPACRGHGHGVEHRAAAADRAAGAGACPWRRPRERREAARASGRGRARRRAVVGMRSARE